MQNDQQFLDHALRIGAQGLGRTWPNPSVGCVLVKHSAVIATAHSADSGRPHAETQALEIAGTNARGATAYVTLEPCAHHGVTPPCAQALIDAGVARVVYAAHDVDPRVNGKGAAMLRAAGIEVDAQLMQAAARAHRGFFRRVTHGMPYIAAKIATSLDGCIADREGKSQWITGTLARTHAHALRNQFDAIITGIGTVLADDPMLTVRLPGIRHERLVRVLCDRRLRLPLESALVRSANEQPLWLITTPRAIEEQASHATDLREAGVTFHVLEDEVLSPQAVLQALGKAGITRALVEAGPALTTAFLGAHCVDTLHWYRAPILLGNTGASGITALDTTLQTARAATPVASIALGPDRCDTYELESCLPA